MKKLEYRKMHALESGYWWYVALHRLVLDVLNERKQRRNGKKSAPFRVLDAGCGTGRLLELLTEKRFSGIGVDASPEAIRFCRERGIRGVQKADLNTFQPPRHLDAVTCLDVLYHKWIKQEKKILGSFYRSLRTGGSLILQVPAFPCLAGAHDLAVEGARRYRRSELVKTLSENGFHIRRASYRISFLFFPVWIRRTLERSGLWLSGTSDLKPMPSWANRILFQLSRLENALIKAGWVFPFGVSLFIVAEKRESP